MDLFLLDALSYRDRNDLSQNFTSSNKTLFGKEQLRWLDQGLLKSNSIWKIVSEDDPIFIPVDCQNDGSHYPRGCNGWDTDGNTTLNFANERNQILKFLDDYNIKNVLLITTDVHFPANIILNQDFNKDDHKLTLYELVVDHLPQDQLKNPDT
jgi:alkaline phosphatase D